MRIQIAAVFVCLVAVGTDVVQADSPATTPAATAPAATSPATTQATFHKAVIPPGFHTLTVGTHTILCQSGDDEWVKEELAKLQPTSRPTTLPSDLIATARQRREAMTKEIMTDLGMSDPKPINELFDLKLIPILQRLADLNPTVYYLVATRPTLVELLKNGWEDPRYHYLRFDDSLSYDHDVNLSIDAPSDDEVMWVEIRDDRPEDRGRVLRHIIEDFDGSLLHTLSQLSQMGTRNELKTLIQSQVTDPLKLPANLQWFGDATSIVYAIKYESELTGNSREPQLEALLAGNPLTGLHPQPLNLVEPLDPATMRPEYIPLYREAMIHKGAGVIVALAAKRGDDIMARVLASLRATPPATPADLIRIVEQSAGVNITPAMLPNYSGGPPQL